MSGKARFIQEDFEAEERLLRGVQQHYAARGQCREAQGECAADGASGAGDENGLAAEAFELMRSGSGQARALKEGVPVDFIRR